MTQPSPLLSVRKVSKAYPGVQALQSVSMHIEKGELLAVVGENGAGKSTLMKIIAGLERPDAGELSWDGMPLAFSGVQAAEKRGIVLIHQELNLADNLDLASSIFLGREITWGGPLRLLRRDIYPKAEALLARVGLNMSPRTRVSHLSVGQQQLVEIARALGLESRLLIMDEPTSSLTETETRVLYDVISSLKSHGVSILYISHRLNEVKHLADRAIVLRDGRNSGELNKSEITPDQLIRLMVGRDLKVIPHEHKTVAKTPILSARNICWSDKQPKEGVSLSISPGEIVGLAGLVGAGRTEFAETLFGIRPLRTGDFSLHGKPYYPQSPRDALRRGIFLVPEDRRLQGLLLNDSVRDNISLASLAQRQIAGIIRLYQEIQVAREKVSQLNIRTPSIKQHVGLLSGGNQQKVVLAKGLVRQPKLLILDEPTRGVDVGAKAEIYSIMRQLAEQGVAILMISSDLEEVLGVSDRVVVLHEGKWAGDLSKEEVSEEAVMRLATGRNQETRKAS